MIEIQNNYKITLTHEQVRQLYNLLQSAKEQFSYGGQYDELRSLCNEIQQLFDKAEPYKDVRENWDWEDK